MILPSFRKTASDETSAVTETENVSTNINQVVATRQTTTAETPTSQSRTTTAVFYNQNSDVSAPYAGLYNLSTGEVLYQKSTDEKIYPASLTKILTAVTALAYMDNDTVITVGTELELLPKHSSLCLIKKGHRLTLFDLLTGMLVSSGNDAAYTVAVNVARNVMNGGYLNDKEALSYFSDLMNSMAKAIGCTDSHFTTPDGFDDEGQYTTAEDLMLICKYALEFDEIREITSIKSKKVYFKSGENVTWTNSNQLLQKNSTYYSPEVTGMKTGTTPLAGKCLIATAEINQHTYIAIVAGCKTDDERYKSAKKLLSFVQAIQ